jgi:hypothetical protein
VCAEGELADVHLVALLLLVEFLLAGAVYVSRWPSQQQSLRQSDILDFLKITVSGLH